MSLDKAKTDSGLGMKVHKYLVEKGVETPMKREVDISDKSKLSEIEKHFRQIMEILNLDLEDDSLCETPRRVAKMYVNEIFWGLNPDNFPRIMTVDNKMKYDEMLLEKNITVKTQCEHHVVSVVGKACVGYIPDKKVIGLSKLNRVVEYFSRRPQVQERLTEQIYYALQYILKTDNIAIYIEAEHMCVKLRGVEDTDCSTVSSKLGGVFKAQPEVRAEFMSLIK